MLVFVNDEKLDQIRTDRRLNHVMHTVYLQANSAKKKLSFRKARGEGETVQKKAKASGMGEEEGSGEEEPGKETTETSKWKGVLALTRCVICHATTKCIVARRSAY